LDLPEVKERVLTVAAIPYSGSTVKMNATNSPSTAKGFFEITDTFPIPGSDTRNDARDLPSSHIPQLKRYNSSTVWDLLAGGST
jgi:hypothetical protein